MSKERFALIDVNSFYCSAEAVFEPALKKIPLVVLSNNDGCVVARCARVKAFGIPMGVPWFHIKEQAKKLGIQARSSNYELYGDMSRRCMNVIGSFCSPDDQEIYSIDESFVRLTKYPHLDGQRVGREIKSKVYKWTGLPVCVGVGGSKTLAKFANHIAKKRAEFGGVCDLTVMNSADFKAICQSIAVSEVWGIGRKLTAHLAELNIKTVEDFRKTDAKRLRERFGVVVEKTCLELNGVACHSLDIVEPRQQIIASRSFGVPCYDMAGLHSMVSVFMARAVHKLRVQGSQAGMVKVFLETNQFREQDKQYHPCAGIRLPNPSADIATLTSVAGVILERIYKAGFRYVKAGVMLEELSSDSQMIQGSLFGASEPTPKRKQLLSTLDRIHQRFGNQHIGVGYAGVKAVNPLEMQRGSLSKRYTTRWNELMEVN